MKIIITLLVIVPWSLIGTAYLAYRRVRGQLAKAEAEAVSFNPSEFEELDPFSYEKAKDGWKVVDADHIAKAGRA